jgi:superfamily I DNA and RNA helicase
MLLIIPKALENMNSSERYILSKLKSIYLQEAHLDYLYLEPKIGKLNPDFILIDSKRGVLILEVKSWSIDFIASVKNKTIKTSTGEEIENPLAKARRYLNTLKSLLKMRKLLVDKDGGNLKVNVKSVVIFTEILKEEVKPFEKMFDYYPAEAIYKEELKNLSIKDLFKKEGKKMRKEIVNEIRSVISPEIVVKRDSCNLIQTLDCGQERFAKSIPFGHYMVTGVPGSGKSVTLISRAFYLAKKYPKWKVLIVVYNKLLLSSMKKRLDPLMQNSGVKNIELKTFHQLSLSVVKPYKDIDLKDKNSKFWNHELPNLALGLAKPKFDAILVDEYQDFYLHWFKLMLKLLKPFEIEGKKYLNLFLAGDRLQSIYNPKEINWRRDIGLDMRGRSKLLKISYRITTQQLNLALNILMKDRKYKKEVKEFYDGLRGIKFRNELEGSVEILEGNYQLVADKIVELLKDFKMEDILLLSQNKSRLKKVKDKLPKNISKDVNISKNFEKDKMLFTTIHSSKGVETKVVIVIDIDTIQDRKLFYVSATRASTKLILHSFDFKAGDISKDLTNSPLINQGDSGFKTEIAFY